MSATDLLTDALSRIHDIEDAIKDGRRFYSTDGQTLRRWADRYLWQLVHDHLPNVAELIRRARDEIATGAAVGAETSGPGPRTATRPGTRLGHSCSLPPDHGNCKGSWTCGDCGRTWMPEVYGWTEVVGPRPPEVG
jgi:hypothetical protein